METAPGFSQKRFNEFIVQHDVIGFFQEPIVFKSGRTCNCYVNWRTIAEDVYLFDELTDYIVEFVRTLNIRPDSFFGVPEGGTKLGMIVSYKWARCASSYGPGSHAFSIGRGKPKDHGDLKDKFFLGMPRGRTIVLEDTTTTGGSLLGVVEMLVASGVNVVAAIALTNRNERRDDGKTVGEVFREKKVAYYALSNLLELLPEIVRKLQPGEKVIRAIRAYFEKYGEAKLEI